MTKEVFFLGKAIDGSDEVMFGQYGWARCPYTGKEVRVWKLISNKRGNRYGITCDDLNLGSNICEISGIFCPEVKKRKKIEPTRRMTGLN